MTKFRIVLLCMVFFLSACRSEFEDFQNKALKFAQDGQLDRNEYNQLVTLAKSARDDRFKRIFYTDQVFDQAKMNAYLIKLFAAHNISISSLGFAASNSSANTLASKFNINVYLENSASVDGYVNGSTSFKDAIYSMLGDISIGSFCDSLNLHYINNKIPFSKLNAGPDDIRNFIQTLNPATFRQHGGDRSSSDMRSILSAVLNKTDSKNASVLISDFVFSPGRGVNAHDYLVNESIGIKVEFADKLKNFDLSLEVLQLTSIFNGFYYDENDKPTYIKCNRPYYIWIIGSQAQIKSFIKSRIIDNIHGGYDHKLLVTPIAKSLTPAYKILYSGKIGSFRLENGANGPVSDAEVSNQPRTRGQFAFNVAVDFSGSLQDPQYFSDTNNFEHNQNYRLSAMPVTDTTDLSLTGFTHQLRLMTTDLHKETISIAVKSRSPGWVDEATSENDTGLAANFSEQHKTFGFKYLISGVYNAFDQISGSSTINSLNITIK